MDKKTRNISTSEFERVAVQNGYEFFTAEEITPYYREGIQKSMKGELSQAEKDEFVSDIRGLQKAICMDENGNAVTYYYRKSQIKWNVAADGTILKGIAGEYADTAENRKLNRVGKAFIGDVELIKSLYSDEQGIKDSTLASKALSIKKSVVNFVSAVKQQVDENLYKSIQEDIHAYMTEYGEVLDEAQGVIKAQDFQDVLEDVIDAQDDFAAIVKARAGRYADTAENRRLHRVGQEYGKAEQKEGEGEKKTVLQKVTERAGDILKESGVSFKKVTNVSPIGDTYAIRYLNSARVPQIRYYSKTGKTAGLIGAQASSPSKIIQSILDAQQQEEGYARADAESGEKPSRNGDSVKRDISILEENKDRIVAKYGQDAYDKKMETLNAEAKTSSEEREKLLKEKRAARQARRRERHARKREEAVKQTQKEESSKDNE